MNRTDAIEYLLVNHSPFGTSPTSGRFVVGDMWLSDLRAQTKAVNSAGGRLVVACPLWNPLPVQESGSFGLATIDPREEGFDYVPLPPYHSFGGWLRARTRARASLARAVSTAAIVHLGDGAHPVPLDQLAWPLAAGGGRVRAYVFDGAEVLPRLQAHADSRRNPAKRAALRWLVRRREAFFRRAIREADLVFAHNAATVKRFRDVWNERCHFFDRSFVTDENLVPLDRLPAREAALLDRSRPLRLAVAGRQLKMKGTDQVLDAMKAAMDRGANLELDVYGEGEDLPAFKAQAQSLGLGARVRFHGAVPYGAEIFARLAGSQMMLVTNLTPEISRNVLLAMALGLVLVAYQNPGTDDLVRDHGAGLLVRAGSVDELARTLLEAERDRAPLVTCLRNARELASRNTLEATHQRRAQLAVDLARSRRR
ncbi:MAG: glycosyltransferase [Planctomycetes bacterium]|nr:glycosyltransferase [Planctomycetota bacterium]